MRVLRNEQHGGPDAHANEPVYGIGGREKLALATKEMWRNDKPETLRAEVDRLEAGPRGHLANQLKNAHMLDAAERNRVDDALVELTPREALAKATENMWVAKS